MYNTKVICTYHTPEVFLDTDRITDAEKEFVRDTIYRQELLDILSIDNVSKLDDEIHNLYEKVKTCEELKECMQKAASTFLSVDLKLGLIILFSFEYLHLTHTCISEFLNYGTISNQNILKLQSNIL
jgi:hypothetical protein